MIAADSTFVIDMLEKRSEICSNSNRRSSRKHGHPKLRRTRLGNSMESSPPEMHPSSPR
jgi:hypothetical protein